MERFRLRYLNLLDEHYKKIIFILCVFCFFMGSYFQMAKSVEASVFEFALMAISDFHYSMFFALPAYFYFLFSSFSQNSTMVISRYRFFYTYFISEAVPISIFALIYSSAPALLSILIGLTSGMPVKNRISALLTDFEDSEIISADLEYYKGIVQLVQKTGSSPALSTLCTVLYTFVGLIFISIIIRFMLYVFQKKIVLLFVIIAYIVDIVIVQRFFDVCPPYLYLNNYFILADASVKNSIGASLMIMAAVSAIILLCLKKRWGCCDVC